MADGVVHGSVRRGGLLGCIIAVSAAVCRMAMAIGYPSAIMGVWIRVSRGGSCKGLKVVNNFSRKVELEKRLASCEMYGCKPTTTIWRPIPAVWVIPTSTSVAAAGLW
jgi:hypothetical protein